MNQAALIPAPSRTSGGSLLDSQAAALVVGFLFWLSFLLVLEPGNVLHDLHNGGVDVGREALRILAASLLGAAVTPLMRRLVQRYPIAGARRWLNLAHLLGGDVILSAMLVVSGCLLARAFLHQDQRSLSDALAQELLGNGPLVGFAGAAFLTLVHLLETTPQRALAETEAAPRWLSRIPIRTRGHTEIVDLGRVHWIETQGNYLALHGANAVWLLRETSTRLEAQLDPVRFVRIHRRTIVAAACVQVATAAGAGDAILRLVDGTELRMSRTYRDNLARMINMPSIDERWPSSRSIVRSDGTKAQ